MPSIHPSRLKIQAAHLAEHFEQPAAFVRGLHALLNFYADRTYRPGQAGELPLLTPAYNTPPPVLRRVQLEMEPLSARNPQAGMAIIDALWAENIFEFRMLAARLLGKLPPDDSGAVLRRARDWAESGLEERLLRAILEDGFSGMRKDNPELLFTLMDDWLHGNVEQIKIGLTALLSILRDPHFENLPALYRLLTPFLSAAPSAIHPELLDALVALTRRSPQEMAYALRQRLDTAHHPDTPWLIRQLLPEFPAALQASLRQAGRKEDERKVAA